MEESDKFVFFFNDARSKDHTYHIVAHVLEGVADDGDAHVDQVRRRHLEHLLRKLFPVLVDLLK